MTPKSEFQACRLFRSHYIGVDLEVILSEGPITKSQFINLANSLMPAVRGV